MNNSKKKTNKKPKLGKSKMNFHVNPLFAAIIGALMPVQGRNGVKS